MFSGRVLSKWIDVMEAYVTWQENGDSIFVAISGRVMAEQFHTICWDYASCVEADDYLQIYVFRVNLRANMDKKFIWFFGQN